ncbi:hypothetical protein [Rhodothermus profundi]|uniref:Transglycosylase SLT domain-containing protein n=1 Tax=Rhodothermus profundi TaxID=633813 RepID=A0A1M6SR53_9BACT|nr:hypothetical protein [Rhodothermus profundi]SHK47222.1 hypothetical protein SAMN04488087_1194 [Rhodothermus profundi]
MMRPHAWRLLWVAVLGGIVSVNLPQLAAAIRTYLLPPDSASLPSAPASPPRNHSVLSLGALAFDLHPDVRYGPYFTGVLTPSDRSLAAASLLPAFQHLLTQYTLRQAVDDNFTLRIYDGRSGTLLVRYELTDIRQRYQATGHADWDQVDRLRRDITRSLLDRLVARGFPRRDLVVRWGRANQVQEAFMRAVPYLEYEIRLARTLNLSLLSTAVSIVETFSDDRRVSPAGARSRYQLMPYLLRQYDLHHYTLRTAAGTRVRIREAWHPLLTMEPAFLVMRSYANAVGHEVPGLSAYHTGPANLFRLYRLFLTRGLDYLQPGTTVLDAYLWAITEGFNELARRTTFREYSRGYIPSLYGTLRALEHLPLDTSRTIRAELVQITTSDPFYLSDLLTLLRTTGADTLDWRVGNSATSLYNRFRLLNPHFDLPEVPDSANVPPTGDVLFAITETKHPIRIFLPLGTTQRLRQLGFQGLRLLQRFDHTTFTPASPSHRTQWDQAYAQLLHDIQRFGFTFANRIRLDTLVARFTHLAAALPSPYRQRQLRIIRTHAYLWQFDAWEQLAHAAEAATGRLRLPAQPLEPTGAD